MFLEPWDNKLKADQSQGKAAHKLGIKPARIRGERKTGKQPLNKGRD